MPRSSNGNALVQHCLRLAVLALTALVAGTASHFTSTGAAATTGLVAAFSFDELAGSTAADASGSGNSATLVGATWATGGKFAGAVRLNGSSSRVGVSDSSSLALTQGLTLEAWVRPSSFASSQTLIAKERPGGGFPWGIELDNGVPAAYVTAGSGAVARGTAALALSSWSFVAATYDGAALRVYVNGTQVGSTSVSGLLATSTGPLSIGADLAWGEYSAGLIDNVRVYNRALSSAELQSDQTTAVAVPPATAPLPAAAYALDETGGTSAADASGNGNTISLTSGGWSSAGKYAGAASFDGLSSLATAADTPSLDATSGLTLEAWVKPNAFAAAQTILAKERAGGGFPWGLELDNGIPTAYVTAATNASATATSALPANAWSFVASTYDGSTLRVYVNGSQVASSPVSGTLATSNGTLSIGAHAAWGEHFNGLLDNVRVYTTALTAAQLSTDSTTAVPGTTPPPPGDTTPPTTPTGVAAGNVTQTAATLSWLASTDNLGVTGYDLFLNGVKVATTGGTTYDYTTLTCGTTYTLGVVAHDAAGNTSTTSTTPVTTTACTPGSGGGGGTYSCTGRSFYVDYAGGTDANGGTSESAPWKRAPGMVGFTGSYSAQPHDCFYFKGGVVWPRSAFPFKPVRGGDASGNTYFGADPSWFTGAAWSRPTFDLAGTNIAGGRDIVVDLMAADHTTFDNVAIVNFAASNWTSGYGTCAVFEIQGDQYVTLDHVSVTNFVIDYPSDENGCPLVQAATYAPYGGSSVVQNSTFAGGPGALGGGLLCVGNVKNTVIHDTTGMIFPCGHGEISGNLLYNCGAPFPSGVSGEHADAIQVDAADGTFLIHDNVIHDTGSDSRGNECESMLIGNAGETDYVWNNVLYNVHGNAIALVQNATVGKGAYIWNNSVTGGQDGAGYCVRAGHGGTWPVLAIQNNYCVTTAGRADDPSLAASSKTVDHNVTQTPAAAGAAGFSASSSYAYSPPSATSATVGAGGNLTSTCTGPLAGLCTDTSYAGGRPATARPASGAWDAGAYTYR